MHFSYVNIVKSNILHNWSNILCKPYVLASSFSREHTLLQRSISLQLPCPSPHLASHPTLPAIPPYLPSHLTRLTCHPTCQPAKLACLCQTALPTNATKPRWHGIHWEGSGQSSSSCTDPVCERMIEKSTSFPPNILQMLQKFLKYPPKISYTPHLISYVTGYVPHQKSYVPHQKSYILQLRFCIPSPKQVRNT